MSSFPFEFVSNVKVEDWTLFLIERPLPPIYQKGDGNKTYPDMVLFISMGFVALYTHLINTRVDCRSRLKYQLKLGSLATLSIIEKTSLQHLMEYLFLSFFKLLA